MVECLSFIDTMSVKKTKGLHKIKERQLLFYGKVFRWCFHFFFFFFFFIFFSYHMNYSKALHFKCRQTGFGNAGVTCITLDLT